MKKIYGTTIFIGSTNIETLYGPFIVYVFQDIIDIKYVFVQSMGIYLMMNFILDYIQVGWLQKH